MEAASYSANPVLQFFLNFILVEKNNEKTVHFPKFFFVLFFHPHICS